MDDPELRFTTAVAPVASTPRTVDREANTDGGGGEPAFMDCTAWRQLAENAAESLAKGRGWWWRAVCGPTSGKPRKARDAPDDALKRAAASGGRPGRPARRTPGPEQPGTAGSRNSTLPDTPASPRSLSATSWPPHLPRRMQGSVLIGMDPHGGVCGSMSGRLGLVPGGGSRGSPPGGGRVRSG
ncbi:hypothetical protein [Streptomyces sp. NPDC056069]|uniref:hypothetical protein n=1 Tax=Streptomyces sp. NPDC056069 TaxID=3345702 RepID=UPI0035E250AD